MDGLRVHVEDGVAYLVSAAPVQGEDGRVLGSVLIAARIDRRFLAGIVDTPAAHTVSGLVLGNRALPLALLGPAVDAARSDYRIGGAADASLIANELLLESDNGNTLRHAVWLDSRQVAALNEPVLARARQQRTLTIAVFALLLIAMAITVAFGASLATEFEGRLATVVELAERFEMPVVTLIDTPGFQRARASWAWLQSHETSADRHPGAVRAFLDAGATVVGVSRSAQRLEELRRDAEELRVDASLQTGGWREVLAEAAAQAAAASSTPRRSAPWASASRSPASPARSRSAMPRG